MDVGPVELLIVLAVVLLLFGSKKLPELAKGMGQAAKEFRSGLHDDHEPEVAEPPLVASTAADGVGTHAVDATPAAIVDPEPIEQASGPTTLSRPSDPTT
jgi:sec-independent protein translocase protein TatA